MQYSIRRGRPDDFLDVVRLFDAGVLETDASQIRLQLAGDDGFVLVAAIDGRLAGAVAVTETPPSAAIDEIDDAEEPWHITAVAVRTERQNRGIGRALVTGAAETASPRSLSAFFAEHLIPFYIACEFDITAHNGQLLGIR